MNLLIIIISFILIIYALFQYIRVYIFLSKVKINSKNNNEKKLYIIIPCLREQSCIKDTIDYFKNIMDSKTNIIIVTTKKEEYEYSIIKKEIINSKDKSFILKKYSYLGISDFDISSLKNINEFFKNFKTTYKVVKEEILPIYDNIILINYPHKDGMMADQLNYVLENIKENDNNFYISIYNADSRPSKKTFNEFYNIPNDIIVCQQYSYAMKNYNKLNILLKGFSIYQSNFEFKTGLINAYFKTKYLYTHVVGHGLFIRYDFIKEIGGFTNKFWCEDIFLTLYLKYKKVNIYPLLSLENMETADTLKKLMKQNAVWFKTTSDFYKMYKYIRNENNFSYSGLIGAFNELRCAFNWLFFPIMIIFLIIISLVNNYYLLILLLISLFIYTSSYTISTIKVINKIDDKKYKVSLEMLLATFLATFISNIGPLYAVVKRPTKKYKTER